MKSGCSGSYLHANYQNMFILNCILLENNTNMTNSDSILILKGVKAAVMFVWCLIFQHASISFFPKEPQTRSQTTSSLGL